MTLAFQQFICTHNLENLHTWPISFAHLGQSWITIFLVSLQSCQWFKTSAYSIYFSLHPPILLLAHAGATFSQGRQNAQPIYKLGQLSEKMHIKVLVLTTSLQTAIQTNHNHYANFNSQAKMSPDSCFVTQSMPRANWCKSANLHIIPHLHDWLLLMCVQNIELLVSEVCQRSHFGKNNIKQSYESKRWLSLVLQLWQRSSYLAHAIAWLIVMLALVIFCSCWGCCMCMDW